MIGYDLIVMLVGLGGVVIALVTLQKQNQKEQRATVKELTQISDKVIENEKNIKEISVVIEMLKNERNNDVKCLREIFESRFDRIVSQNQGDHKEITDKLVMLQTGVTDLAATFKEYRRTRNGKSKIYEDETS